MLWKGTHVLKFWSIYFIDFSEFTFYPRTHVQKQQVDKQKLLLYAYIFRQLTKEKFHHHIQFFDFNIDVINLNSLKQKERNKKKRIPVLILNTWKFNCRCQYPVDWHDMQIARAQTALTFRFLLCCENVGVRFPPFFRQWVAQIDYHCCAALACQCWHLSMLRLLSQFKNFISISFCPLVSRLFSLSLSQIHHVNFY